MPHIEKGIVRSDAQRGERQRDMCAVWACQDLFRRRGPGVAHNNTGRGGGWWTITPSLCKAVRRIYTLQNVLMLLTVYVRFRVGIQIVWGSVHKVPGLTHSALQTMFLLNLLNFSVFIHNLAFSQLVVSVSPTWSCFQSIIGRRPPNPLTWEGPKQSRYVWWSGFAWRWSRNWGIHLPVTRGGAGPPC